jgi:hypothetical protein
MLAVASCLLAASLEAGFLWARRGFGVWGTLGVNSTWAVLDFGFPPAWQVLALGLVVAVAAAGREMLRPWAERLEAGRVGSPTMAEQEVRRFTSREQCSAWISVPRGFAGARTSSPVTRATSRTLRRPSSPSSGGAAVLIVELERQFALAGEADAETLDLYRRVAGNVRRMLESVGLERRAKDAGPWATRPVAPRESARAQEAGP